MVWGAIVIIAVFAVGMSKFGLFHPQAVAATPTGVPAVTAQDLTAAGFTNPTVQPPAGGGFAAPVMYFHVGETVAATHPEWKANNIADLVAVSILPTDWIVGATPDGADTTQDLSGRAGVCGFRAGAYVCVIGPDEAKSQALLNILKAK